MSNLRLIIFLFLLIPGLAPAQTRWMRLHPDVSWKYLKQWEKTHQWLTPARAGRILFQQGEVAAARTQLEKALAQGSDDGRLHYELAYCYQLEGNQEKAAELYHQAIERLSLQSPPHIYLFNSHYLLGNIQTEKRNLLQALDHYEKALKLQPQTPALHYRKALIFRRLDRSEDSLSEIKQLLDLEPSAAPANYLLGLLYLERNDFTAAQSYFQKAMDNGIEVASAAYCLGYIAASEDRREDAVNYYQQALQSDPTLREAHLALANLFYEIEDYPGARQHFEELSRLEPNSPRWHYNLGVIYRQLGKADLAETEFQMARSLDPDLTFKYAPPEGLQGLSAEAARCYQQGELEKAIELYRRALLEDPFYLLPRFNLAVAYTAGGQESKARRQYSRLLRIEPDYSPAHLNLGILAYRKDRSSPESAHHLRRYLELERESEQKDLIKRYLHEIRGW